MDGKPISTSIKRRIFCGAVVTATAGIGIKALRSSSTVRQRRNLVVIEDSGAHANERAEALLRALSPIAIAHDLSIGLTRAPIEILDTEPTKQALTALNLMPDQLFGFVAVNLTAALAAKAYLARVAFKNAVCFFSTHTSPVEIDFVQSLSRPRSRMTGITYHHNRFPKLVELAFELRPAERNVVVVFDKPNAQDAKSYAQRVSETMANVSLSLYEMETAPATSARFLAFCRKQGTRLAVIHDMSDDALALISAAARQNLTIVSDSQEGLDAGAVASLLPQIKSPYQVWARQIELVARGVPIGDIPVEHPTTFLRAIHLNNLHWRGITLTTRHLATFDSYF